MSRERRFGVSLAAAAAVLAVLVYLTFVATPGPETLLPGLLFLFLIVFTTTFGVPLAGGQGSFLPMTTVAAYLVMGPVPTAWAALAGAFIHGWVRRQWAEQLEERLEPGLLAAVGLAAANAVLQTVSILAAHLVFEWTGGTTPLLDLDRSNLIPLLLLCLTYLGTNLLMAGLYFAIRGAETARLYIGSSPRILLYEGWPLIFAPLMTLAYTRLGLVPFLLVALAIIATSLVTRSLNSARQRLERRVQELDSLQAVGQALSASLDLETILAAVHTQVAKLMPARNFYVALYDAEIDEVSFPLAIEDGERVHWRSRRMGSGLTEYVQRGREPLLIPQDYDATLEALDIDKIGRPATCWLGVPILAGDEALGVITVQSYSPQQTYDASHQEVLTTIAAQAAVAIQNARLYAHTDEALTRRVQELGSILRTTREGVLLLGPDRRLVSANRAAADFLGTAQLELSGLTLDGHRSEGEPPLAKLLDYEPGDLDADFQALMEGQESFCKQVIVLPGTPERHVERTLTPVRNHDGDITGWLLVLRDLTEERELARLREELTDMLIHDLRSPLTVIKSSLEVMEMDLADSKYGSLPEFLTLAQRSGEHVLHLVNNLLDVSRLESGQMSIHPVAVEVGPLLHRVAARLAPMANQAQIAVEISAASDLPLLEVDHDLLDRVLHNLLDNALKFTPDGGLVRLWARLDPAHTPPAMLVGVSDNGPGIPPDMKARLFQRFQQIVSTTGRRTGSGLGLPFCRLAVETHGGQIWAETEPGSGSTFVMRLPIAHDSTLLA
jgi:signal transduction histidine kinase